LGAVPAIAAAAVCSISTKQPRRLDRTAGCDRTFKSRYRFAEAPEIADVVFWTDMNLVFIYI